MTRGESAAEVAADLAARAAQAPMLAAVLQAAIDAYADYQYACRRPGDPIQHNLWIAAYATFDCVGLALLALTGRAYSQEARNEARLAAKAHVWQLCGPPEYPSYATLGDRPQLYPAPPEQDGAPAAEPGERAEDGAHG